MHRAPAPAPDRCFSGVARFRVRRNLLNKAKQLHVSFARFLYYGANTSCLRLSNNAIRRLAREQHHCSFRRETAYEVGCLQAVHEWHFVIEHHHVGMQASRQFDGRAAISCLTADFPARVLFNDVPGAFAQRSVVIRQQNSHALHPAGPPLAAFFLASSPGRAERL